MAENGPKQKMNISFEVGTGYDFFASLHVLHNPGEFGLRGAWAAGVRSRLSREHRDILEEAFEQLLIPLDWILSLPPPKDVNTILTALEEMPAEQRVVQLLTGFETGEKTKLIQKVVEAGEWTVEDRDEILGRYKKHGKKTTSKKIETMLAFWVKAPSMGEEVLDALRAYQDVFFAQEEKRILPRLEAGIERARARSQELTPEELFIELSRGVSFESMAGGEELTLIPSYWLTPLIVIGQPSEEKRTLMFGARRPEDSLVPGEVVPDQILLGLKALADPTRLRILSYLAQEALTPAELARRLRLRAPTVTHHLHALRLAELVSYVDKNKQERLYSARMDALEAMYAALKRFLETSPQDEEDAVEEEVLERG